MFTSRGYWDKVPQTQWHKQQKFILSRFWRQKWEIRLSAGPHSLWRLEGRSLSYVCQILVTLGVSWPVVLSVQCLPLSSHGLLLCVCLKSPSASLYNDTCHKVGTSIQGISSGDLKLNDMCKDFFFFNKLMFTVSGVRMWMYLLRGHHSTHSPVLKIY